MITIESAGISDVGRKRKNNEDALLIDQRRNLFVVADGMGGHKAGEVASQLTVDTIRRHMAGDGGNQGIEPAADADETLSEEANRLLAAIQLANACVYRSAQENEKYSGMGSTVSAVYFKGNFLTAANVGDSPIYLIHKKNIEPLYVPHTVISEIQDLGSDAAQSIEPKYRHMLTRAIGTHETVKPDVVRARCFKDDILVVCSDGLSNKVGQEEICNIAGKDQPAKVCQLLVELANERGGNDNITVIVLKVTSVNSGIYAMADRMIRFLRKRIGSKGYRYADFNT